MDATLAKLRDALQWRLDVVTDRALYERDPDEHLKTLQAASSQVDELARDVVTGNECPPMLAHYLERQSYVKALDLLKESDAR
ncbi:MAG: hypothetical protein WA771_13480 [Chthoniobacterales bacterium]